MPQRVTTILTMALGVLGLAVLAALIVFRADLGRAATTGPRWKRRLVGAGLLLLATIGASAPGGQPPSPTGLAKDNAPATAPAVDPVAAAWERIDRAWDHAEALAGGRRGEKPFDVAGKKAALAEVDSVAREIAELVRSGGITAPEAALLRAELELTRQGLAAMPPQPVVPKDEETDYQSPWTGKTFVMARIKSAGAALKAMAAQDRLNPRVVARALPAIEGDLGVLTEGCSDAYPTETAKSLAAVRERVTQGGDNLAARPEWVRVAAIWGRAEYACTGGTPAYSYSELGKLRMLQALHSAVRDVETLRTAGLLCEPEKTFLTEELRSLIRGTWTMRSFAERNWTCYYAMPSYPRKTSPEQMTKRVALLAELSAQAKIRPEVLVRATYTLERDYIHLTGTGEIVPRRDPKPEIVNSEPVRTYTALRGRLPTGGDLVDRAAQWKQICHTLSLPVKERRKDDDPDPAFYPMQAVWVPVRLLKASGDLRPNESGFMEKAVENWSDRSPNPDPRNDLRVQVAGLDACLVAGPVSADFAKAAQIVLRHYRDLADKAPEPNRKDLWLLGGSPEEDRQAASGVRQASVKLEKQLQDVIDAAAGKSK